jgi:tetratricopeptide (TPR) repeat protein
LDIERDHIDLHRFRALVEAARVEPRPAQLLDEALDLWQGPALADIDGEWAEASRLAWQQQQHRAAIAWAQARLAAGGGSSSFAGVADLVVDRLASLAEQDPLSEGLAAALMRALVAAGRQVEALDRFRAIRRLLADQLGVEPGPELQRLHRATLRGDVRPAPVLVTAPRHLPPDVRRFTGRVRQLEELSAIAGVEGGARVVTITGTAGVGKTALAVHWAHRNAGRFPDGQLFVNLRGFGPGGRPLKSDDALRGLLEELGVAPQRIPIDSQARLGLYRGMLAERRVLIIIDNAVDAEHARPLLPASPGCLALVTSRDSLDSMIALEDAHPLALEALSTEDARQLLSARLGAHRVAAEGDSVAAIISGCAHLPLALALVAARAAGRPAEPLGAIAAELSESDAILDLLSTSDEPGNLRAVLGWSYNRLSPSSAQLYRRMCVHPGSEMSLPALAAAGGLEPPDARRLVRELVTANMVISTAGRRYGMHDLLRLFGGELAEREDATTRDAVMARLTEFYVHSTWQAVRMVRPRPGGPAIAGSAMRFASQEEAVAWLDTELPNMLALARREPSSTVDLLRPMTSYLPSRGRWEELEELAMLALRAASERGDQKGRALVLNCLAFSDNRNGDFESALGRLEESLRIRQELGDLESVAACLDAMGMVLDDSDRPGEAIGCLARSLRLHRRLGNVAQVATTLHNLGKAYAHAGRFQAAKRFFERSLPLRRQVEDPFGEACTTVAIGQLCGLLAELDEADRWISEGIRQSAAIGYSESEWAGLVCRAQMARWRGEDRAVEKDLTRALAAADEMRDPYARALTLTQLGVAEPVDVGQRHGIVESFLARPTAGPDAGSG